MSMNALERRDEKRFETRAAAGKAMLSGKAVGRRKKVRQHPEVGKTGMLAHSNAIVACLPSFSFALLFLLPAANGATTLIGRED